MNNHFKNTHFLNREVKSFKKIFPITRAGTETFPLKQLWKDFSKFKQKSHFK